MRSCNFWRLMFNKGYFLMFSYFKILGLLPHVLILFLVEKWILPSRSETAEIGQKNRRNFRV
jgi:hypothetical protein